MKIHITSHSPALEEIWKSEIQRIDQQEYKFLISRSVHHSPPQQKTKKHNQHKYTSHLPLPPLKLTENRKFHKFL
jgi:hypothetical protein